MEKHINIVAALQIGLSILRLIIIGIVFAILHFVGDFSGDHDAQMVLSIIANVMIVVCTILSLPSILAGIGLFKRKEWARILTLIISVLELINFPIGTAVGVYSIWALSQNETVEFFKNKQDD
ncbi:hypothetical protein [Maribellus sediminis]|uniref:hypothetical protein n=1 Tax=Maribellus sediminis TaxID=2696285 RepID=UPI00142F4957|nr:hypothetical protein [Maribellus sediminis]